MVYIISFLIFGRIELLRCDVNSIPEIIQSLGFQGEEDIDAIMCEAVTLYKITPRSLCRYVGRWEGR